MEASPPRYRRFSRPSEMLPQPGAELPPYSRRTNTLARPVAAPRQPPTEHLYQLLDGKGKPWASLKVLSSAKSSKSLPTFFEKENINGTLELNVGKGESIQAITAIVTGRIMSGATTEDSCKFLNVTVPVWSKAPDAPRLPSSSPGTSGSKLCGQCVWPITIVIPRTVTFPGGSGEQYKLPETWLERHINVSIQYDLTILISRGILRADNQIITAFGYVPATRPDPPSMLRQLAYEQNVPIPGPDVDPAGWEILSAIPIRGYVFKTRRTETKCTIALAKPLCYTRGTTIPCRMVLQGEDLQTLDLLSSPKSIHLALRRRLRFYNKTSSSKVEVAWNETFEEVAVAAWWSSTTDTHKSCTRYLEGEIQLAKDLKPTAALGHFSISYDIILSPFDAIGFATANTNSVIIQNVQIATMRARGPKPQTYSPPAYEPIDGPENYEHTIPVLPGIRCGLR